MNDIVTANQTTDLTSLDAELASESLRIATAVGGRNSISAKAALGVFAFPDGDEHHPPLRMVVLAGRRIKQLWNKEYDPRDPPNARGLVCAATGDASLDANTLVPFQNAPTVINPQCNNCPQNHWERNGGRNTKIGSCKDGFVFAVMHEDVRANGGDIFVMRMSPTGVTESARMMKAIKGMYQHSVKAVVEFSFVPAGGNQRVSVKVAGPNENYAIHAALRHEGEAIIEQEPRWFEGDALDGEASVIMEHAAPKSTGRKRSAASDDDTPF